MGEYMEYDPNDTTRFGEYHTSFAVYNLDSLVVKLKNFNNLWDSIEIQRGTDWTEINKPVAYNCKQVKVERGKNVDFETYKKAREALLFKNVKNDIFEMKIILGGNDNHLGGNDYQVYMDFKDDCNNLDAICSLNMDQFSELYVKPWKLVREAS